MDKQPTQFIPPNYFDMNELISQLFIKINQLEQDVRQCHQQHLEATQFQNGALARTLERNTQVLENIELFLKKKRL